MTKLKFLNCWGSIKCKHIVGWQHLSQIKARLFWLVVNIFFQLETLQAKSWTSATTYAFWWSPITSAWSSPRHARPNVLDKRHQNCSLWVPLDVWAPIKEQSLVRKWKSIGRKVDREEDGKTRNTNFCSLVRILEEICLKQFDWNSFFLILEFLQGQRNFQSNKFLLFCQRPFQKKQCFLLVQENYVAIFCQTII